MPAELGTDSLIARTLMQHCIGRRKKDERKNRINETIASTTQRHKCMSVRIFGTPTLSFEVGKKRKSKSK